jgi:hypothetical protein
MEGKILVVSRCDIFKGVSVIVMVVDYDALLLGVLISPHLPQHL